MRPAYDPVKYEERVRRLGGSFTPFAVSVYGTLAPEAERTILTLMKKMSKDVSDRKISEACARLRIQLAILRATSMCIRSRSHDNNTYGAIVNCTEEGVAPERSEEEDEEPLDLEAEWYDSR